MSNENRPITILIAEDSPTQAEELKFILEKKAFNVLAASNGKEALGLLDGNKPDIVISDIVMPEMDGYEFCRRIRSNAELKDVPVILVTTLSDPADVIKGLEVGANNFIMKPYEEKHLFSRIQYLIANKELRKNSVAEMGINVFFSGENYFITAERLQILDLLLSTYESAYHQNQDLIRMQKELMELNERLEDLVGERTAELSIINRKLHDELVERKRAEESLQQSEARYKRLIESVTSYIYSVQLQNGRPNETIHGEGCFGVTGYTSDEYKAEPYLWHRMVFDEDKNAVTEQAKRVLAGEVTDPLEHRIIHKDGSVRWVRNTAVPRFDEQKRVVAYDGLISDITMSKKLQEAEIARISAEAANKTKSEFLATMSHELRTPLNSVLGFARVLKNTIFGALNDKQREYIYYIEESGEHLLNLINDILDLAKVEAGKMELELSSVSVGQLLEGTVTMLKEKAYSHNIEMTIAVAEEADITIEADARKLKQILFNLISNAVKFTPDGGSVRMGARLIRNSVSGENAHLEISVADTGPGIKPGDMELLFREFTQLDSTLTRAHEGTGLGLALTKKLVALHGGRIWAESEFGRGSRFIFSIPCMPALGGLPSSSRAAVPARRVDTASRILPWDDFRKRAEQCVADHAGSGKIVGILQCDSRRQNQNDERGQLLSRYVRRDDFIGYGNTPGRYVIALLHADRGSIASAARRFQQAMDEQRYTVTISVFASDEPDEIAALIRAH